MMAKSALLIAMPMAVLSAARAYADLYRWVDPQTGSVKFSSYPPPWFGQPALELNAPATEVVVYRAPGAPKPALPPDADFSRAGSGIQQQIEAYQAAVAELDRLDPAGAARRRQQEAGFIETLRRGLEAQFRK